MLYACVGELWEKYCTQDLNKSLRLRARNHQILSAYNSTQHYENTVYTCKNCCNRIFHLSSFIVSLRECLYSSNRLSNGWLKQEGVTCNMRGLERKFLESPSMSYCTNFSTAMGIMHETRSVHYSLA